eukprot:3450660-Prymnesium_polylepis.1
MAAGHHKLRGIVLEYLAHFARLKGRSWFPLSRTPLTKVVFSVFAHGSIRGRRRESSCRYGQFWRVRASR